MQVNNEIIAMDQLADRLRQPGKKERLSIWGDRRADLGTVVDVWDASRLAGFREVNIATEPRKEKNAS